MALVNDVDDGDDTERASNKFILFPTLCIAGPPEEHWMVCPMSAATDSQRAVPKSRTRGAEVSEPVTPLCDIVILNQM